MAQVVILPLREVERPWSPSLGIAVGLLGRDKLPVSFEASLKAVFNQILTGLSLDEEGICDFLGHSFKSTF